MWNLPNCHLSLLSFPMPAESQREAFSLPCARDWGPWWGPERNDHQLHLSACSATWSLLSAEFAVTLFECRAPHLEAPISGGPPQVTKMVGLSPWHTAPVSLWLGPSGLLSVLHPWGVLFPGWTDLEVTPLVAKNIPLCIPQCLWKTIGAWLCWDTQGYQGLQRSQVSLLVPSLTLSWLHRQGSKQVQLWL